MNTILGLQQGVRIASEVFNSQKNLILYSVNVMRNLP